MKALIINVVTYCLLISKFGLSVITIATACLHLTT